MSDEFSKFVHNIGILKHYFLNYDENLLGTQFFQIFSLKDFYIQMVFHIVHRSFNRGNQVKSH